MDQKLTLDQLFHRPISRELLVRLKIRALRRRVWFRVLDRVERGLMDLTIRWVDRVRSGRLARVLLAILVKLVRALDNGMGRVSERGRIAALRASRLAVGWGNVQAYAWRFDESFWQGLARMSGSPRV